jgi:hypothetical protein
MTHNGNAEIASGLISRKSKTGKCCFAEDSRTVFFQGMMDIKKLREPHAILSTVIL